MRVESEQSLLREHVVADLLGVSVRTVRTWRQLGRGPRFIKLGRAVRYRLADVDAFIAAGRRMTNV